MFHGGRAQSFRLGVEVEHAIHLGDEIGRDMLEVVIDVLLDGPDGAVTKRSDRIGGSRQPVPELPQAR